MIVSMIIRMGSADIESFVEIRLFLFCERANFSPPAGLDLIVIQCWVPPATPPHCRYAELISLYSGVTLRQ